MEDLTMSHDFTYWEANRNQYQILKENTNHAISTCLNFTRSSSCDWELFDDFVVNMLEISRLWFAHHFPGSDSKYISPRAPNSSRLSKLNTNGWLGLATMEYCRHARNFCIQHWLMPANKISVLAEHAHLEEISWKTWILGSSVVQQLTSTCCWFLCYAWSSDCQCVCDCIWLMI